MGRNEAHPTRRQGALPHIDSLLRDARHRQADPPALARRIPDGGAALGLRARRQAGGRGLLGDVRRGLRAPLLRRPQRAARRSACRSSRSATTSPARSCTRCAAGALLPAAAPPERRRARRALDRGHLLDGQFAYAEPLRLALQNLALGRPNPSDDAAPRGHRCGCSAAATRPRSPCGCRSSRPRSPSSARCVFRYWSISLRRGGRAHRRPLQPVPPRRPVVRVGRDHDRDGDPHLPARRDARRRALRDPPRARLPHARPSSTPPPGATAPLAARRGRRDRRIWVAPEAAWLVERAVGRHGTIEQQDDRSPLFTTPYADCAGARQLADRPRRPGRAALARRAASTRWPRARARRRAARGRAPPHAAPIAHGRPSAPAARARSRARSRRSASPCCRRCWPTLLAACGERAADARSTAAELDGALQARRRGARASTCSS